MLGAKSVSARALLISQSALNFDLLLYSPEAFHGSELGVWIVIYFNSAFLVGEWTETGPACPGSCTGLAPGEATVCVWEPAAPRGASRAQPSTATEATWITPTCRNTTAATRRLSNASSACDTVIEGGQKGSGDTLCLGGQFQLRSLPSVCAKGAMAVWCSVTFNTWRWRWEKKKHLSQVTG